MMKFLYVNLLPDDVKKTSELETTSNKNERMSKSVCLKDVIAKRVQ